MLNRKKLVEGFESVREESKKASEKVEEKIKLLKENVGQSLTDEQFHEMAQNIRENELHETGEQVSRKMAECLAEYLNAMEDMTGEKPKEKFTIENKNATKPIFDAILKAQEIGLGAAEIQVQMQWRSFFPIKFQTDCPPEGSEKKISSRGSYAPIGSISSLYEGEWDDDKFIEDLSMKFHTAATSIQVKIKHLLSNEKQGSPLYGTAR